MIKIGILGGGSWGTAFASVVADREEVILYIRDKDEVDFLNKNNRNRDYLSDNKLSKNICASTSIEEVCKDKEIIINAIPTQATREVLYKAKEYISEDTIILNLSKGIEVSTMDRISEIVKDVLPNNPYVALSGPSHAEEVIKRLETSVVISSSNEELNKKLQERFNREYFRIYTNQDLIGVEFGGALKNVLAFGIGVARGLGVGDNAVAALITRGMYEMSKFVISLGGKYTTIYGLAGLGDLIVTATSKYSRNSFAGILFGKGYNLEEVEKEIGMAIEGIKTCEAVYEISKKLDIEMPISEEIYKMIYMNQDPNESVKKLMNREIKNEFNIDLQKNDVI